MWKSLRRVTDVTRQRITGSITLGHGVNEFFSVVIPPIIPLLVSDLGVTYDRAGFLLTVFFTMYLLFQLPAGILADQLGKIRLMVVGLFGTSIGILLAGLAPDYRSLLAAQAIAGISGSTFHPGALSIISDVESSATEGKAMGVFSFGGSIGTMAAPLIVGGLAAFAGWRVALIGAAIIGGAISAIAAYFLGTVSIEGPSSGRSTSGKNWRSRLGSVRDTAYALATGEIVILTLISLLMSLQHRAVQTFTTSYVATETGAEVAISNLAFFSLASGSIASLWGGEFADRMNRVYLGIGGSLATAFLVGTILSVNRLTSGLPSLLVIGVLVVWFAIIGATMYATYPAKNALIAERADATRSGSLFGIIQTGSAVGSATGPALFGVLATQWGIVAAFPAIAVVSLLLAVLFGVLIYGD